MPRILGTLVLVTMYVLHQDFWLWREARPLVFGIFPIGLFYHAVYTVSVSLVLVVLVRVFWPQHLDDAARPRG